MGDLFAQTDQPQVTFSDIKVISETVQNGIQGAWVEARINVLPQLPKDTIGAHSKHLNYQATLQLANHNHTIIRAAPNVSTYTDLQGLFCNSITLPNTLRPRIDFLSQFFIPFYALDLPEGNHQLNYQIEVHSPAKKVVGTPQTGSLAITIPPRTMIRVAMEHIKVKETAPNGGGWDLSIFSAKEKRPDLQWRIIRNGIATHQSIWVKNSFSYSGSANKDRCDWFFLSEGDQFDLEILDHDITSTSDRIGTFRCSPSTMETGQQSTQFESVEALVFNLETRIPPRIKLKDLRNSVSGRENGVSGFNIAFGFEIPHRSVDNQYTIEVQQECSPDSFSVPHLERSSGPASLQADGRYQLVSQKGEIKLFLPYHALCQREGVPPPLHFRIIGTVEGKAITLWEETLKIKYNVQNLNDLEFGQFKAGIANRQGQEGIRFSSEYSLPPGYLEAHPGANVQMVFGLEVDGIRIPTSTILLNDSSSSSNVISHQSNSLKGAIDLFLPFSSLPSDLERAACDIGLECIMVEGDAFTSIGRFTAAIEVELPPIQEVSFRVSTLKLKKSVLRKEKPNVYWVAYVGQTLLYKASPTFGVYNASWGISANVQTVVAASDEISILLVHESTNGELIALGNWKGKLESLPQPGETIELEPSKGVSMKLKRKK